MLALFVAALVAAPLSLSLAEGSKLSLEGDSNLHAWKCEALKFDAAGEASAINAVAASLSAFELAVPVDQIRCGSGTMEGKLRDALRADRFPRIDYTFTSIAPIPGTDKLEVKGTLSVAGVEKAQTTQITIGEQPGGIRTAQGVLQLKMSDSGIAPPTALLGVLKTADAVTIRFDLKLLVQTKPGAATN